MNAPQPQRVAIVDHGMGNLRSVWQAAVHAAEGLPVTIDVTDQAQVVRDAHRVILPGQGAMRDCMAALRQSQLEEAVREALASKPVLGVCVGMQMLLTHSDEQDTPALDVLPGQVRRFPAGMTDASGVALKVPHMGWNRVQQAKPHPLWAGIDDGAWFYFVHSYYAVPADPAHTVARSLHGLAFTCAVAAANIFATQFHPEKSAAQGLRLYRNFLHWTPCS